MQIKFGSVKLAKMYMKRVAAELQSKGPLDKDTSMDYMLLQGVRFAFRIHQVCVVIVVNTGFTFSPTMIFHFLPSEFIRRLLILQQREIGVLKRDELYV